jgi:hypothetical protein
MLTLANWLHLFLFMQKKNVSFILFFIVALSFLAEFHHAHKINHLTALAIYSAFIMLTSRGILTEWTLSSAQYLFLYSRRLNIVHTAELFFFLHVFHLLCFYFHSFACNFFTSLSRGSGSAQLGLQMREAKEASKATKLKTAKRFAAALNASALATSSRWSLLLLLPLPFGAVAGELWWSFRTLRGYELWLTCLSARLGNGWELTTLLLIVFISPLFAAAALVRLSCFPMPTCKFGCKSRASSSYKTLVLQEADHVFSIGINHSNENTSAVSRLEMNERICNRTVITVIDPRRCEHFVCAGWIEWILNVNGNSRRKSRLEKVGVKFEAKQHRQRKIKREHGVKVSRAINFHHHLLDLTSEKSISAPPRKKRVHRMNGTARLVESGSNEFKLECRSKLKVVKANEFAHSNTDNLPRDLLCTFALHQVPAIKIRGAERWLISDSRAQICH